MKTRKLEKNWKDRILSIIPFGLGRSKPKHFRDMAGVVWQNRDNPGYAWRVLRRGVCDGCALGVAGFHDWTLEGVHLCMTRLNLLRLNTAPALDIGRLVDVSRLRDLNNAQLRALGRLPYPLLRRQGESGFHRIEWTEALERIASRIRASDPRRLAFYLTSRGLTNEVYYVAQKVARFLGTNNVDNAARLCHSPSTGAMKHALGVAASTCSYRDWYGTDLVVFFGSNPANDQPVATKYLHEAKRLGTRVVLVNPYLEPGMKRYWVPSTARSALFGTDLADYWFPVSLGGDIAFLYGTLKVLMERDAVHGQFIDQNTVGWDDLCEQARALPWDVLEKQSGLDRGDMVEFATLLQAASNAVFVWSMGVTQHAYGGDTVSMILNLGLARGYVGRPRNGLMPIRGHSGVQGGAEMGAYATALPGGQPVTAANARRLGEMYGFAVPDQPGLPATEMVEAGARGELDLLYCLGGNFLRTLPEPDYVARAMANVPMRVHQDIILTDQMFLEPKEAVILLPAKTRYEQDDGGTQTTTERRILFSPELPRVLGEARAEWRILRDLAAMTHPDRAHQLRCETGQAIREEIAAVVPFYEGIQHLKNTGDAIQYGGAQLCADGRFPTADGKAHFRPVPLPVVQEAMPHPISAHERMEATRPSTASLRMDRSFLLSTRRGKQFNTLIYHEIDPITGAGRDAVFMNPDDAAALHLCGGDRVVLTNDEGRFAGRLFIAPIARGNLQVHWPEGNVLLRRGITDAMGGVPDYNTRVQVEQGP